MPAGSKGVPPSAHHSPFVILYGARPWELELLPLRPPWEDPTLADKRGIWIWHGLMQAMRG